MILGSYSISNILIMYKDQTKREKLSEYVWVIVLYSIVWILALILLVYYWTSLELWAQIFGSIGLLFNEGGPVFTLLVIFLGMKEDQTLRMNEVKSLPLSSTSDNKSSDNTSSVSPTKISQVSVTPTPSKIDTPPL